MKKFIASLCCESGIIGGGIWLNNDAIIFNTQKLIVPVMYKNIRILYWDVKEISIYQVLFTIPVVTIHLKQGLTYKFIIFNRNRFLKVLNDKCNGI